MKKNIQIFKNISHGFSSKKIFFSEEARKRLFKGISLVCDATQITLGPKGRNVALENELGLPKITKDGVTVAKSVHFAERTKEMGAALLRRVSHSTNLYAGDGTTTSTILAKAIIEDGMRFVNSGINPFEIKKGMEKSRDKIIEFLEEITMKAETEADLYNIAKVSCNYNENIAKIVSNALWNIGIDGIIEIEPGALPTNDLIFTEGVSLNRGYASSEFVVKKNTNKIEMDFPLILMANQAIEESRVILPILEKVKNANKPLFIICKDISNSVLSNLLWNVHKGILEICAITVPGQGDFTKIMMEDLAILTGSYLFDESENQKILECSLDHLGKARKIKITEADTFISGSGGSSIEIAKRMEQIKLSISKTSNPPTLMILKDRLSRMSGKMAVILCGGSSEVEMYENREKFVDALNSTKLAMKTGMLPGGGISLLYASKILEYIDFENNEQNIGRDILRRSLEKPVEILMKNAGLNGKFIIGQLLEKYNDPMVGYDLNTNSYVNMKEKGVMDCFLIVKTALEDAVSVGSLILTSEVVVANEKEYTPKPLSYYPKDPF